MGQEEAVPLPVKPNADMLPESPRKAKAPARRLSVPPPPGRPALPGSRSYSRARAVRPEDDPFLAAYLACTRSGTAGGRRNGGGGVTTSSRPESKERRRFTWAGLGLGLSCKSSGAAVEQSMVKLAKRPGVDPRDA